jgi:hypothetical protein
MTFRVMQYLSVPVVDDPKNHDLRNVSQWTTNIFVVVFPYFWMDLCKIPFENAEKSRKSSHPTAAVYIIMEYRMVPF